MNRKTDNNLPYRPRIARGRRRQERAIVKGQDSTRWTDFYHTVLTAPWWLFILEMAGALILVNSIFAGLYMLDPAGIQNARPNSFWDHFLFSVQTMGSIGYSAMLPKSVYANVLVAIEAFVSLLSIAVASGIMFARMSRPTSRVVFSDKAVVTRFNGMPTMMFRVANQRGNQILEAQITVTVARQIMTKERQVMRRFEEIPLLRSRTPLFQLSWTVMHPIDKDSPLYDATIDTMLADQMEIIVMLSGTDDTFADKVYARHSYMPHEICWDKQFVDVLFTREDGRRFVDLRRFHDVEDLPGG